MLFSIQTQILICNIMNLEHYKFLYFFIVKNDQKHFDSADIWETWDRKF